MAATRAQKMRLGLFLIVSTAIVVVTLIYLVGTGLMEVRDPYRVVLQGGSSGLEAGSQVRFNDIVVGRIEHVRLDPEDPGQVIVELTLEHGTPVTVDTVAVPEMANITGTKMLSMHGGTKNSPRLKPGDTIQSAASDLSMITTKVVTIADKLQDLLDNLTEITKTENATKLSSVLNEVEGITKNMNALLDKNQENINVLVADARSVVKRADEALTDVQGAAKSIETASTALLSARNVRRIETLIDSANGVMVNVKERTSKDELGVTISNINALASSSQVTVLRLRDDLRRIMSELETSVENINELTQILVDDPSVLISGRNEKERQLPR